MNAPLRSSLRLVLAVVVAGVVAGSARADPVGDVAPCVGADAPPAASGGSPVDLTAVRARIVEGGTAVEFTATFAERLPRPGSAGGSWRLDVLLRDPTLPSYEVGPYEDVNRIVRYDAARGARLDVLLLPERGRNEYLAVRLRQRAVVARLPGRLLVRDEDLAGIPLDRLRWGAAAWSGENCDLLGAGAATRRIRGEAAVSGPAVPDGPPPTVERPFGAYPVADPASATGRTVWTAVALVLGLAAVGVFRVWVRGGRGSGSSASTARDPGS